MPSKRLRCHLKLTGSPVIGIGCLHLDYCLAEALRYATTQDCWQDLMQVHPLCPITALHNSDSSKESFQSPGMSLSFAHLWWQLESSDMDVILLVPAAAAQPGEQEQQQADAASAAPAELAHFPAHSTLLSNSEVLRCRVSIHGRRLPYMPGPTRLPLGLHVSCTELRCCAMPCYAMLYCKL